MASRARPRGRRRVRTGVADLMDELMTGSASRVSDSHASGNDSVDDDETESEPDYGRPSSRHNARVDSDSASDAAEDLEATSSNDDSDRDVSRVKLEARDSDDDTTVDMHSASHHRDQQSSSPSNVKHERVRLYKADDGDDDANDAAADDEDESDDETEDDESDVEVLPASRAVSSADFERASRYEAEEQAIIQNEERGVRDLFGDNDNDGDVGRKDAAHGIEAPFSDDTRADAGAPSMSFTDALLSADRSDGWTTLTGEPPAVQNEAAAAPLFVDDFEMFEAKSVLWSILSNVSHRESVALRRGGRVDGPPTEDPIAHVDEFRRKFRWPVRVMNLPKNDFAQDPSEIYDDYELQLAPSDAADARLLQHQRTFAQVPRPIVEAAAAAMAAAQQQSTRKRKRPESETTAALNAVARASEAFTDSFLESLICDNAAALQGAQHSHSQRSWTRLPVSRMPVANWRFVLEHAASVSERARPSASVAPPLREATLARIRARLKTLNALPWQHADDSMFDTTPPDTEAAPVVAPAPIPVVAPAEAAESPSEEPAAPESTPAPAPAVDPPAPAPAVDPPAPAPAVDPPAAAASAQAPAAEPAAADSDAPASDAPTPDVVVF